MSKDRSNRLALNDVRQVGAAAGVTAYAQDCRRRQVRTRSAEQEVAMLMFERIPFQLVKYLCCALALLTTLAPRVLAQSIPPPPQGTQTDAAFSDSFKSN